MRYAIFFILTLPSLCAHTQNLIPNGSFEEENICTEYRQNCAPEAWIARSLWANYYYYTPGKAYEGTHFVGLSVGDAYRNGPHNFIRTRLLCGLQPGRLAEDMSEAATAADRPQQQQRAAAQQQRR